MLLWKELHAFPLLRMPVRDLVNHFLLLSVTGSGYGHYIAEVQWQTFNFPVRVCVYSYFVRDRHRLQNTFRKQGKNVNDKAKKQTNKMCSLLLTNYTTNYNTVLIISAQKQCRGIMHYMFQHSQRQL